uniref:Ribonuclease n=1 Tax=Biomphalaria glabrata TaxID=6526 RepID=A0A2C9LR60_BIOGL
MYKLKIENSHKTFAGIDEVGRGCLAGPVVAALVALNPYNIPCGVVYEDEIDRVNILNASKKAMLTACLGYSKKAKILVDGPYSPCNDCSDFDFVCVVNGDELSVSIAAASIIAKV